MKRKTKYLKEHKPLKTEELNDLDLVFKTLEQLKKDKDIDAYIEVLVGTINSMTYRLLGGKK
jgi:hypothetical protein